MDLDLKLRNSLEVFVIGTKYGNCARLIGKKYNLQNLIGAKSSEKLIKELYRENPQIFRIASQKIKETRPPWFVRNITLSSFSSNKGYKETFSKDCIDWMVIGTILYLAGDCKDDFTDSYLEDLINPDEKFEKILDILKDERNLLEIAYGNKEAFLLAETTESLHRKGLEILKEKSQRCFNEYIRKKAQNLDPIQAKDFYYRFCLRKGRIEEVRKNLVSTEKILETQRKLGEIAATWVRLNHIFTEGNEKYLENLERFFLYTTSTLNLAGDDLKEVEEDFSSDKKSKVGIKNPANALALQMIADNYDFLSLKELRNYLRRNIHVIYEMLENYLKNMLLEYEKIKDSEYAEDLPYVLGLAMDITEKELKKFRKKFGI